MLYKGIKVLDIEPVIYLRDKAKDCKYNQLYVQKKLQSLENKVIDNWGIECPINDMVLIYLPYRNNCDETNEVNIDVDYLINSYNILKEVFENVEINFYLDMNIDGVGNSFDMSIGEFEQYLCT